MFIREPVTEGDEQPLALEFRQEGRRMVLYQKVRRVETRNGKSAEKIMWVPVPRSGQDFDGVY